MHRGPRPTGQPRTLRSIAEDKGTLPANFVDGGVEATSGLPVGFPTASQHYVDDAAVGVVPGSPPPAGPSPFTIIRKG